MAIKHTQAESKAQVRPQTSRDLKKDLSMAPISAQVSRKTPTLGKSRSQEKLLDASPTKSLKISKICPLNDPDLPAVGEMEHAVGYCFCHHCVCGKHVCTNKSRLSLKSASCNYNTIYKQEFIEKSSHKNFFFKPGESKLASTQKSADFATTNQQFFKSFKVEKKEETKDKKAKSGLKLDSRSSYKKDFINYKVDDAVYYTRPKLPYRGHMVKQKGSSTYKDIFKSHDLDSLPKPLIVSSLPIARLLSVFENDSSLYRTTTEHFFKRAQDDANLASPRVSWNDNKFDSLHAPKGHFETMYRSHFSTKDMPKHLMRRN